MPEGVKRPTLTVGTSFLVNTNGGITLNVEKFTHFSYRPCESKALPLKLYAPLSAVSSSGPREVSHIDHLLPEDDIRPDTALDLSSVAHTLTQAPV